MLHKLSLIVFKYFIAVIAADQKSFKADKIVLQFYYLNLLLNELDRPRKKFVLLFV